MPIALFDLGNVKTLADLAIVFSHWAPYTKKKSDSDVESMWDGGRGSGFELTLVPQNCSPTKNTAQD
jgi:hypothetical protein